MSIESFKSTCNFYDTIHFRHGFDRAGVFTRKQAEILSSCGFVIKQLERGEMTPRNEDHEQMLRVINGEAEPSSEVEKAWVRYLTLINTKVAKVSSVSTGQIKVDYSQHDGDNSW